ncbi:MAG: putative metal-dependent hydrolase [Paenibacillaceae bacterium]|nr:putative metal-dependent hydrolase [Paenibacillaceae bacterium]
MEEQEETLRYPIGRFVPEATPLPPERRAYWIGEAAGVAERLQAAVAGLTPAQLRTPYRSGGWTVLQVVHHMADNDVNAYLRFKRALTEERLAAPSYLQEVWAERPDYGEPPDDSLLLLRGLHGRFVRLLRSMRPDEFARAFTTEALGAITLDTALQRFVWHNRHHTAQIVALRERNGWTRTEDGRAPQ